MNILNALKQLRDDIKAWVTNNLNALNEKIDEKTIPIDNKLDSTSTNPVQNKVIKDAIDNIPTFSGDYNDLTNAPDISEDGSGNMIIADESGNIIFKADADGMHATAVSINGESAATEKYVDEAVASIDIPEVDFTGYATEEFVTSSIESAKEELGESIVSESEEWKVVDSNGNIIFSVNAEGTHTTTMTLNGEVAVTEQYVDDAIANIDFPTTDLTGYATKEYVDNAVDGIEIPEVDFTGYATETYVDGKVADLVNSAPEVLDTLGELAIALENHEDAYDALLETVGGKATHTDLENLKEELSESIVADSDEWKVVDEAGNIIFSIDATGAHTTSLTLDGESVESIVDTMITTSVDAAVETLRVDTANMAAVVLAEAQADASNKAAVVLAEAQKSIEALGGAVLNETDPTVPAWAKEATKPSYTAEEVGALPNTTPLFSGDYNDLENAPNIEEDNAGNLIIADNDGNIIFRSDVNGFETTQLVAERVVVGGVDITEMLGGTSVDVTNINLISVEDIDAICGETIQVATTSEVTF